MRWIIEASRKRGEKGMKLRLAGEVQSMVAPPSCTSPIL
jgi:small subunit ribosomal protein S7